MKVIQEGEVTPCTMPDFSVFRYKPNVRPQPGQILVITKTLVLSSYDIKLGHHYTLYDLEGKEEQVNPDIVAMIKDANAQNALAKQRQQISKILGEHNL
jgi:hypothetical protein